MENMPFPLLDLTKIRIWWIFEVVLCQNLEELNPMRGKDIQDE